MSRQQKTDAAMEVFEATTRYESWMRRCTPVVEAQLRRKHEEMTEDVFCFLRGTFYRWAQLWPGVCSDLRRAPNVLAVGDLHVNSFGTWRDAEGRMCRGVDDFDEAHPMPYVNDLVRLGASAKIVIETEQILGRLALQGRTQVTTRRTFGAGTHFPEARLRGGRVLQGLRTPTQELWMSLGALRVPLKQYVGKRADAICRVGSAYRVT